MTDAGSAAPPLAGVRVLDLSDEATALGARLLADLGAEVIRVEPPAGDALRDRAPFLDGERGLERSLAHLLYNGGKRSLALDLEQTTGRVLLEQMLPAFDVVIAPLVQPSGLRLLLQRCGGDEGPALVDVIFRRDGPEEATTDLIAVAAGGLLHLNGFPQDPPNYPAGKLAYKQLALAAAEGALALVLGQGADKGGGTIVVSLQEAVVWTTLQSANQNFWHWLRMAPHRAQQAGGPITFKSSDDRWVSFTIHPPNWSRFLDWAVDLPEADVLRGPEWEDLGHRGVHRDRVAEVVAALCARHTRDELIREGQARGLLVLPVHGVAEIAVDPHLRARGFFHDVPHPQLDRTLTMLRAPFLGSDYQAAARPAPALGAQTEETLRALAGLDDAALQALRADGVIAGPASPSRAAAASPVAGAATVAVRPGSSAGVARLDPSQPLAGVRVLDFCWAIAGSLGTRLLADLGADVLKVESEYRLDPIRYIGVQPEGRNSLNTNGVFNDCSANKRAMTLNLNTPEGIEIAKALVREADIVTSNYTPDRLDRWGLDYETLRGLRPDIIVANLAVMGTWGPHKDWRSYGSGIVAMCGLADLTGFEGRAPIGLGTLHSDFTVPYFAAMQILAALIARRQTGQGTLLELSQYEASIHLLDTELVEQLNNGVAPGRRGNRSPYHAPHGVYASAGDDRWLAIDCRDDADWSRLAAAIGRADLAARSDLASLSGRRAAEDEIDAAITAWSRGIAAAEAVEQLRAVGVPVAPVQDLEAILTADAGMAGYFERLSHPEDIEVLVQHEPILWNDARLPLRLAPQWSEHTEAVLRDELGLSADRLAELAERGVLY